MLTVEITSRAVFYTAPCQNSPQPSDQDKLNTILAVSIFIPFYKRGRMVGQGSSPVPVKQRPPQWTASSSPLSLLLLVFLDLHHQLKLGDLALILKIAQIINAQYNY